MAIKLPKSKVKCQNSARVPSWKFGYHVSFYSAIFEVSGTESAWVDNPAVLTVLCGAHSDTR